MALSEIELYFERANNIQSEYANLLESHKLAIRKLEASCRKSEDGHIWMEIIQPPIRNLGPPRYIQVCQCCGFYCKVPGYYDINLIRTALSAETILTPEKDEIRRMAIEEYGEKQDNIDSLSAQLKNLKKEIREILEKCKNFLGEQRNIVRSSEDDACYWDD